MLFHNYLDHSFYSILYITSIGQRYISIRRINAIIIDRPVTTYIGLTVRSLR